jgi:hypothetical protein
MPAGFVAGALGGTFAALALLCTIRGLIHLRWTPTVLPAGEARAVQLAIFLLSLAGGGLGRTHGWALQFALVLVGILGARYFTYGGWRHLEVVGLPVRAVDEEVSRVVSSIWLRDRDSCLLGPVPLILVTRSPWEPRTVWLSVSPDDHHVLSLLRFGLARRLESVAVDPHPLGLALVALGALLALLALASLGW